VTPGEEEGRVSAGDGDELRAAFAGGWRVDAMEPATMDTIGGSVQAGWQP
jgi:hypothetical protein